MRIHLYGQSVVPTTVDIITCAFVQYVHRYAQAFKKRGHYVIIYGTKEYAAEYTCDEYIPISTVETFRPLICQDTCEELLSEETIAENTEENRLLLREAFSTMWCDNVEFMSPKELHDLLVKVCSYGPYLSNMMGDMVEKVKYNIKRIGQLNLRERMDIRPGDIFLVFYEVCALELYQEIERRGGIVVEASVGYGTYDNVPDYNRTIFHSFFKWHLRQEFQGAVGLHHKVIPPFFTVDDFIYNPNPRDPKGPYLYLARLQVTKGFDIFLQLAQHMKDKIFWAAGPVSKEGNIIRFDDKVIDLTEYSNLKYWGIADKKMRAKLLSQATALIQPSLYDEPFGCNVIEANLSGTPAIAPARGAFVDTIEDGLNGFKYYHPHGGSYAGWRFRMENCALLSPEKIRTLALALYSEEVIMTKYLATLEEIKRDPGPLLIPDHC